MAEPSSGIGPESLSESISHIADALPGYQAADPHQGGPLAPISRSGGRRVRVRTAAIIVAVLGTAVGLLVARPWQSPPLLAPAGVGWGSPTATSVRVFWQVAPGSLKPDGFLVLRDGRQVASTPGTALSYVDNGLAPGDTYAYTVLATSGGQRSKVSSRVSATTSTPAPVQLTQAGSDYTSVTLAWSPPPAAPAPDEYDVIDQSNYGAIIARVPGRVHSYTVTHLSPGGSGQYEVDAVWSGHESATTPTITATARMAPLDHDYNVTYTTDSVPGTGASLHAGQTWTDQWSFSPVCAGARCSAMKVQVNFDPPSYEQHEIDMTLRLSGGGYVGTVTSKVTTCGGVQPTSPLVSSINAPTEVTNTITVAIAPDKTSGGQWTAWHAAMQLSAPDTIHFDPLLDNSEECPPQSWEFTVAGQPAPGA